MGKSLKGKNLGEGITQRSDGMYVGRFTNRFGKRQTVTSKKLAECKAKLSDAITDDKLQKNVIDPKITLDEWFERWLEVYKKNCRKNTIDTYKKHYLRVKDKIGYHKLNALTSFMVQDAINSLDSDNERKNSRLILADMLECALYADLVTKNVAKRINTKVTMEEKRERKVLTSEEEELFLKYAASRLYYPMFVVALQTGMRIGELTGLMVSDLDFEKGIIHVNKSLTYFSKDGKYTFEIHKTKTASGTRDIPMTSKCRFALKQQIIRRQNIINRNPLPEKDFQDLLFISRNYNPTQEFLIIQCMKSIVREISKKENIDYEFFAPHTFRHTFATNALNSGMKLKTLSRILGHKSVQLTIDLYCHVLNETMQEEMKVFEENTNKRLSIC